MNNKKNLFRVGCLDLGSNALKYKQYRIIKNEASLKPELETYKRIPIRLGTDVFNKGKIKKKTIKKIENQLSALLKQLESKNVKFIGGFATSAMRTAGNGKEVCDFLNQSFDINLKILSGEEEADLLLFLTKKYPEDGSHLFVDVGGGSTEFFYSSDKIKTSKSFNLGAVRIYLDKDRLSEWNEFENYLNSFDKSSIRKIVGVGGNIRSIISIITKDKGHDISLIDLDKCLNNLLKLSNEEKITKLSLSKDRADIIESAGKIFLRIMNFFPKASLHSASWSISDALVDRYLNENYAGLSSEFKETFSSFNK